MNVLREIAMERLRQQEAEGFTEDHDNEEHAAADLALAAASYAVSAASQLCFYAADAIREAGQTALDLQDAAAYTEEGGVLRGLSENMWPWDDMYKPKDVRRDLIRAAALIVAQIEQIDAVTEELRTQQGGTEQTDE